MLRIPLLPQALCVIANIANGSTAKEFVMGDESLLKRLMQYMMNDTVKLQMAATYCVSSLVWIRGRGPVSKKDFLLPSGPLVSSPGSATALKSKTRDFL